MIAMFVTGNGILLKGEQIILPEKLQLKATEVAHKVTLHPWQIGLVRRSRQHLFFYSMNKQIKESVKQCHGCSIFIDKIN